MKTAGWKYLHTYGRRVAYTPVPNAEGQGTDNETYSKDE